VEQVDNSGHSKIKFDPTINLGHILTFAGFIITIIIGWNNLDKRVVVIETNSRTQELRDKGQDIERNNNAQYITQSMADLKRSVERLSDKVDDLKKDVR
jgi:phage-related minor tail protein